MKIRTVDVTATEIKEANDQELIYADNIWRRLSGPHFSFASAHGYVYALEDPITGVVCYVGSAIDIDNRYKTHLKKSHSQKIRNWVEELSAAHLIPRFRLLRVVHLSCRMKTEKEFIQKFSRNRCLLNTTYNITRIYKSPLRLHAKP